MPSQTRGGSEATLETMLPAGMLAELERSCPGRGESLAYQLLDLKRADALAKASHCTGYAVELDAVTIALRAEIVRGATFRVSDLAVNGGDVMHGDGCHTNLAKTCTSLDVLAREEDDSCTEALQDR